jgi:hypothetical protein
MYVCVCACVCAWMHACACVYAPVLMCTSLYTRVCMHVHACVCMCVWWVVVAALQVLYGGGERGLALQAGAGCDGQRGVPAPASHPGASRCPSPTPQWAVRWGGGRGRGWEEGARGSAYGACREVLLGVGIQLAASRLLAPLLISLAHPAPAPHSLPPSPCPGTCTAFSPLSCWRAPVLRCTTLSLGPSTPSLWPTLSHPRSRRSVAHVLHTHPCAPLCPLVGHALPVPLSPQTHAPGVRWKGWVVPSHTTHATCPCPSPLLLPPPPPPHPPTHKHALLRQCEPPLADLQRPHDSFPLPPLLPWLPLLPCIPAPGGQHGPWPDPGRAHHYNPVQSPAVGHGAVHCGSGGGPPCSGIPAVRRVHPG